MDEQGVQPFSDEEVMTSIYEKALRVLGRAFVFSNKYFPLGQADSLRRTYICTSATLGAHVGVN